MCGKGKAVPVQGSRRLWLPDFKTAREGGKVVSPTHRLPLRPQEIFLVLISVRG